MTKPEKKRGRPADKLAMTPQEAATALDRMLGKEPEAPEPASADEAPRVRSKRPPRR